MHRAFSSSFPFPARGHASWFSYRAPLPALLFTLLLTLLLPLLSAHANAAEGAAPAAAAPAACVPLEKLDQGPVSLSGYLSLLEDPERALTVEGAAAADRAGRFSPTPGSVSRGFGQATLWIRFCLPPNSQRLWLRATPSFVDHLTLYTPAGSGYRARSAGDTEDFRQRELPFRDPLYQIDGLDENAGAAPRTFYMQMRSGSSRAAQLTLYTPAQMLGEAAKDYFHYGLFGGIALLAVVLHLALWFWLRERTNLYYAGVVALITWNILLGGGFVQHFWPAMDTTHANLISGLSILLTYAAIAAFLARLFDLRATLRWAHRATMAVALACLAAAPFAFFLEWRLIAVPMQSLIAASQVLTLAAALVQFARQPRLRFYVIAFLPIQLNILAVTGRNLGVLPASSLIIESATISSAVHIILLTVALAQRAFQAESDKKQAQDVALAASRQAGRDLEARVAERTVELSLANQSLEREVAMRQILQGELQQALSAEKTAHAAQKEFVSMVSHEFRNPLAVIDTVAQRMEETLTERHPDLVASAGRMRRSVARLLALIENCLTEDRLSSPYMLPRVTPVDLALLLKTHYADRAERGPGGRVHLHLPDEPVIAPMDAHLIGTAISNLVENALKYSPVQHAVDVSLTVGDGMAEIRVSDRGAGIVTEDQERIFEKFYRAAAAQRLSGAGLGLYLARELAQRHGGDVRLIYSSPAQGTCFSLTLPLPMQVPAAA